MSDHEAELAPEGPNGPVPSDVATAASAAPPGEPGPAVPAPAPDLGRAQSWGVVARSVTLSALIGVALAFWVVLAFGGRWVTPFLSANDLPMDLRMALIKTLLAAAAVGALGGAVTLVVLRRKGRPAAALERLLWFLSPLLVLPFLPQLFRAKPWRERHDVLLPLALGVALVTEILVRRSLVAVPERLTRLLGRVRSKLPELWRRHGPLIVVVGATLFYVAFMSFFNLRWHYKLKTHNFDLAIDNNLIYSALKGAHMESTVSFGQKADQYLAAHAKLGQYVILPIYALYPKPETLIVIQSALLGAGALPLFGFARRHVPVWSAVALALAYLAYYPLHSANFVESKYLSLSCFFVLSTFWAIETRRWVLFGLAFFAATLMREDVPVGLAVGGAFLLLTGHRPLVGLVMAAISSVWFVILRFFIMDSAGSWWFPDMYKGLWATGQQGFGSVIKTLLTNPLFVLNEVLEKEKLLYLLHLTAPLVLLPLRRWWLWAALVPGTILTLLATDYKPLHGFSFQYVMHWVPYLFLAAVLGVAALFRSDGSGAVRARAALAGMLLASAVLSYNYGAFAAREGSVKGGYFYIDFSYSDAERQRYAQLREIVKVIPADASVVATENVGPHVSSRRYMYAMRRGIYDAEYMLAARNELDFEQTRKLFTASVKEGKYGVIQRVGDFVVLKRGHDVAANEQLAQDWKL